ncbi:MAG: hypothetical protein WA208_17305 [Thermoanaerobaculia bacterium]
MLKISAALLGIAVCVVATSAAAAPSSPTGAKATSCVAENRNAVVEWPAERAVSAARIYFRSANAKTEHYVDMRREGGRFQAVLPQVASGTTEVQYRVAARDAKGAFTTRASGVIAVSRSCPAKLSPEQARQASMIVVGMTSKALVAPIGFRCEGIIGTIDDSGKLHAQKPCTDGAVAQVAVDTSVVQTNNNNAAAANAANDKTRASAPSTITEEGPGLTPYHHRRPRRAPQAPQAPRPRLEPPVSPARP